MRAEELLETLTDEELRKKANSCFSQAETSLGPLMGPVPEERHRLLTEADFYIKALARREDARVARRDFRMEVGVMVLIGLEIILSVYGLWEGHQQGKLLEKQTTALSHMDTSTAATSDSLQKLVAAQDKSLARLNDMNDKLQASLTTTGAMAKATSNQLDIVKQEQNARIAEAAKKPLLNLYATQGAGAVCASCPPVLTTLAGESRLHTETSITADFALQNDGDRTAHNIVFRLNVKPRDVSIDATVISERPTVAPDYPESTILINIKYLRPHKAVPFAITFNFQRGHAPFQALFSVDADEIESGSLLAVMTLTPDTPAN